MSDAAAPVTFERLLAHRDWVRAVARSIARDANVADDLEQETWLEALRAPPRDDRNLRGWLGTVLRNRARKRGRSGARRAHHEAAAPVAGPTQAAGDVVAEAEAQQRIVAAVLGLDEPYRTTVLLRFYEGLPPREVGARMGVPSETVRTRVRRAAARLREALGGDGTDLSSWMGAVAPLLGAPAPSGSAAGLAAAGAVTLHTKKTIAIATLAALLLGGACAWVLSLPSAVPPVVAASAPATAAAAPIERTPDVPERVRIERPAPAAAPMVVAEPEPEPPPAPVAAPEPPPEPAKVLAPMQAPAADAEQAAEAPAEPLDKGARKRAKVRAKYEEKGGYTFYDLRYWVNAEKLKDSRWSKIDVESPRHDRGVQLHARWTNEASATEGMTIDVVVLKLPHYDHHADGRTRTPLSYPFEHIGESVRCDDEEALIEAFFSDWRRAARDVDERRCQRPRKSKQKFAKVREAVAVGTDPTTERRERHEWYVWPADLDDATYVLEIRYGSGVYDNEALVEKGPELLRHTRALKENVRWGD